ncbi:MAG: DNA mismatch repair protein MutT [Paracoccaceae bacterium]
MPAEVRDAATIILMRSREGRCEVLMGQRGAAAAFMPSKFVFPGGAVDEADAEVPAATPLSAGNAELLARRSGEVAPAALASAAIRELWEEAGLLLGKPAPDAAGRAPAPAWRSFLAHGVLPHHSALTFFLRAVTPPGRPRRFDARFFLSDAGEVHGDVDDFSAASDELSGLHWIAIDEARHLDLPFITEVVLAEVSKRLSRPGAVRGVPFFDHRGERSYFCYL